MTGSNTSATIGFASREPPNIQDARASLNKLREEGAPQRVIDCATLVVENAAADVIQPSYLRDVLMQYQARRMQQNKWGK